MLLEQCGVTPESLDTLHLAGAFGILSFLVVHLYMITTGHTLFAHTRAMITGWEEVREDAEIEDWERKGRQQAASTC